jgi:VIT1/CCC1 family predicted Fe2+/Mn2+ transporter
MALFVLVGAMVPLLPIALLGSGIFARALVVVASLVTLFCLGAYAGVRIKKNVFTMGLRTSLVGMIVWGLAWAIGEVLAGA